MMKMQKNMQKNISIKIEILSEVKNNKKIKRGKNINQISDYETLKK